MRPTRRNRGAIVVLAGFTLMMAIGLAVIAIDLTHLSTASGEVQTLADAAAAGAARSLMQSDGKGNPTAAAQTLLASNTVDGKPGKTAAKSDVQVGNYDFAKAQFAKGGATPNAVRVTVVASVQNIVAGVYGDPQSTVTREAIAAFSGNSSARPTLPLAISKCTFASYQKSGCGSMTTLKQAPDGKDGSGWTSLGADNASASKAVQYLPADCGGGGVTPPRLRVGDPVGIMNGQANSVLKTVGDCVAKGHDKFTVPVVDVECNGKFNKQKPVLGFATVKVVSVTAKGGSKSIDVTPICDTSSGEMGGGPDYGTRNSSIVR